MFQIVYHTVETTKRLGGGSVRLALVTDLHRKRWGERQELLIDALEREAPDAVLMSGDIFHHLEPFEGSRLFVEEAAKRFPCFYVTGNHENKSDRVDEFKRFLREKGVTVLEGACKTFAAHGSKVNICGVDEYRFIGEAGMHAQLKRASAAADPRYFTILLSHRPELIHQYLPYGFDLILCGHAHGGQWRIPFVGAIYVPELGWLPKDDLIQGLSYLSGIPQYISPGMGSDPHYEHQPGRIFNNPVITKITLTRKAER